MTPWPHQSRCVDMDVPAAIARGERRICVTSPTGGGKTWMMQELARKVLDQGGKVVLYSNRKMLIDQTSEVLMAAGIYHGVRAAGYADERDHPFQVSSIQTEHSRVTKRGTWKLHEADLAIVDEAHLQTSTMASTLLEAHHDRGATYIGFTATPLNLGEMYDTLIQAGTVSELRECGALVPAHHFGPDEPDMRAFKKLREGEDLTEKQQKKAMMVPGLWGRVWSWFEHLNPQRLPTILFAPGVPESIWFAEQFTKKGVRAAHIDGQDIWLDGKLHPSNRELRQEILDGSRDGSIAVLCNRFVLREGIDAPWLAHGILATVFGSLQSYLQSGGRLLRAFAGLDRIAIQDHGGNWWRHGSLNADREWDLAYTPTMVYGLRADRLREKKEQEPRRCPQCSRICLARRCCCGYEFPYGKASRPVATTDGSLKEMVGDIFKPRRISSNPNGPKLWEQMYHRSCTEKGAKTFRQAAALFAYENNWSLPDPGWPFMPTEPLDQFQLVKDVPREMLVPR